MNRLLPFLLSLFTFLGVSYPSAFAQRDFLGMPNVSVGDEDFFLRWSSKTRQGRLMEEFLPEKMDMTNFEQKLVVEVAPVGRSLNAEVAELLGNLARKKEQNVVFSFQQVEAQQEGELWIEYVQGNVQGGQTFTIEWNLARYAVVNGRVVFIRYIQRHYDKELDDFMKKVNRSREKWMGRVSAFSLENIKIVE